MTQSGVQIREMTEADVTTVSTIRVRGWQWAYAGLLPQGYLDAMDPEQDAAERREFLPRSAGRVQNLVAEVDGAAVGWAAFGPYRGEPDDSGDGELYALYVLPEHVGTGVGRALITAAVRRTAELGRGRLLLWVLAGNDRARRFYQVAGFAPDGAETSDTYDGVPLREVRYVREVA